MQRDNQQCERACYTLETIEGTIIDSARDELALYIAGQYAQEERPGESLFLVKHTLQ